MPPSLIAMCSSGDLIADRRYAYGEALREAGDLVGAADVFRQALEIAPDWAAGWRALGRALAATGDAGEASAAFRKALAADPNDALGVGLELARLDAGVSVSAAPAAYVTALFDAYAPSFDRALVEALDYRAPQLIADHLRALPPVPVLPMAPALARVLDLGCGTGLMGEALRAAFSAPRFWLEGLDLSPRMLDEARAKGLYDALHEDDLHSALLGQLLDDAPTFDLIVAADVLIYTGDLAAVVNAAAQRLSPGGRFAFTLEAMDGADGPDWLLRESLRFAHNQSYARRTVLAAGLDLETLEEVTLRLDRGRNITGWLVVARRASHAETHPQSHPRARLENPCVVRSTEV